MKISAIVVAKNEEEKIKDCLESLVWCDEMIVIDNGSTDETAKIAKKIGSKVFKLKEGGSYSDWRNEGLRLAKGEWILYVDADERITPSLQNEIELLINSSENQFNAYAIPRKNIVMGKELKHGGFGKYDYVKRLFKKNTFKEWTGELHEEPNYYHKDTLTIGKGGEVGHLTNKMIHLKASTLSEMVEKTNKWSAVEAKLMFESNHPTMNVPRFCTAIFREFWFRMIKHKAYLDGQVGTIHAIYQIFSRFLSYAKLWEMQLK